MKRDYFFIVVAGFLWGIIPLFVRGLSAIGFDSLETVAIRVWFSALIMICFTLYKDKRLLMISIKDIAYFIGTGIVSLLFFNYCYFETINYSNVSLAVLLLYTSPIFVMLISLVVLKEKLTINKVIALLVTIIGLGFITGVFEQSDPLSARVIIFGLGSGLGYALYSIFGKLLVNKYHSLTITTYTFIFASIGIIPFVHTSSFTSLFAINNLLIGLGIGLICTALPFLAYTKGLNSVEAGKAAIIVTIEPLISVLIGVLFFKEGMDMSKFIGMVCILASIIILNMKFTKSRTCNSQSTI